MGIMRYSTPDRPHSLVQYTHEGYDLLAPAQGVMDSFTSNLEQGSDSLNQPGQKNNVR